MAREIVLETNNLCIGYPGKPYKYIQTSLNLQLEKGTLTSLLGLNGSGKSTLLRTICAFQDPIDGAVMLNGKNIKNYTTSELSKYLGVVLTEKGNAGGLKVYDLVSLGRYPYTGFFGKLSHSDETIICESMEAVGINHKKDSFVSDLSDGERQKAMIAKALAQRCPVIILDEPTAFLDITSRIETMILLKKIAREQSVTILLSSHDLDTSLKFSDRLWLLSSEHEAVEGDPESLIEKDYIAKFFNRNLVKFDKENLKKLSLI